MKDDVDDGEAGKRLGMSRAARAADPYWWICMMESAKAVALKKPYLFFDDITKHCDRYFPDAHTHENRAKGPVMMACFRLGYFLPTQDFVPSSMKQNHKRPERVWYSLIYRGKVKAPRFRHRKIHDPRQYDMPF